MQSARSAMATGLFSLLVLAACETPITEAPEPGEPLSQIVDAAHDGLAHFYFLPPMVDQPTVSGTFDGGRDPLVRVCEGTLGCATTVAGFTTTSGPGSETIRVDGAAQHYAVNWHTDGSDLVTGEVYRIHVLVDGVTVGHADVVPVSSGRDLKNYRTGDLIPLLDGRTLPIKFRIEEELVLRREIAFMSDRNWGGAPGHPNGWDVFVINDDGTGLREISANPTGADREPTWSRDGTRLAYVSGRPEGGYVWVVNADGTGGQGYGHSASALAWPDWSADGQSIVYQGVVWYGSEWKWQIHQLELAAGQVTLLTDDPAHHHHTPVYSPDGSAIAYHRNDEGGTVRELRVMAADGSGDHLAATGSWAGYPPAWTADGQWLAYYAHWADGQLHLVRPDGTGDFVPSHSPGTFRWPAGAPSSGRLAVQHWTASTRDVGIYDPGTDGYTPLSNGSLLLDWWMDWSAEEARIAVTASDDLAAGTSPNLWVFRTDGSGGSRLSAGPWTDRGPTYRP